MEVIAFCVIAVVAGVSYCTARFCSKSVLIVALLSILAGIPILFSPAYLPKDYLLHVPGSLVVWLHPYVLVSLGVVLTLLGMGSFLGFGLRKIVNRCRVSEPSNL
jgi:hypothetical protein